MIIFLKYHQIQIDDELKALGDKKKLTKVQKIQRKNNNASRFPWYSLIRYLSCVCVCLCVMHLTMKVRLDFLWFFGLLLLIFCRAGRTREHARRDRSCSKNGNSPLFRCSKNMTYVIFGFRIRSGYTVVGTCIKILESVEYLS